MLDCLLLIQQKVAQEPYRLNQIGFARSSATDQDRDWIKIELHVPDALEIPYFDSLNHKTRLR